MMKPLPTPPCSLANTPSPLTSAKRDGRCCASSTCDLTHEYVSINADYSYLHIVASPRSPTVHLGGYLKYRSIRTPVMAQGAKAMAIQTDDAVKKDLTAEVAEWIEAFDEVVANDWEQGAALLAALRSRAREAGVPAPGETTTPYINTIPKHDEVPYPGDRTLERRIEALLRWNAMAMVHKQNKYDAGIGGHISTYSSLATLLEVGFYHFFHGSYPSAKGGPAQPGDFIYFQGHAAPGIYARAYLLGRFDEGRLKNFRHELRGEPGLSSYPHPWLMKDFWQFPTVSMGIGPLNAIYQARSRSTCENRGLIETTDRKVWAFVGDGETDEVDTLGAINLGSREKLDNLIFVVNCNLQRLDGPVRGNGRIIDELEATFHGAGWNVIKVIWVLGLGRTSSPGQIRGFC